MQVAVTILFSRFYELVNKGRGRGRGRGGGGEGRPGGETGAMSQISECIPFARI
jgi:hypothetical protein